MHRSAEALSAPAVHPAAHQEVLHLIPVHQAAQGLHIPAHPATPAHHIPVRPVDSVAADTAVEVELPVAAASAAEDSVVVAELHAVAVADAADNS